MPGRFRKGLAIDEPVYRIFKRKHFFEALRGRELYLSSPHRWEDPFENMLERCQIIWKGKSRWREEFLADKRAPIFAQCWSATRESDSLWRTYSWFRADPARDGRNAFPDEEGVQVRSTPRKLINALATWAPPDEANVNCVIGPVVYVPEDDITQTLANIVAKDGLGAFPGPEGHADSILFKRKAFEHEAEVRLIYVDMARRFAGQNHLCVPFAPESAFDEVVFEPRLATFERIEHAALAEELGFPKDRIRQSMLYQKTFWEFPVPDPDDPPVEA